MKQAEVQSLQNIGLMYVSLYQTESVTKHVQLTHFKGAKLLLARSQALLKMSR